MLSTSSHNKSGIYMQSIDAHQVGHLMGDGGGHAAQGVDAGGVVGGQQRSLPVQQQSPVLHRASRKVRDGHQVQFRQRVGNAQQPLVRRQHMPRYV